MTDPTPQQVAEALHQYSIPTKGTLKQGLARNNLSYTDNETVFVKVSRSTGNPRVLHKELRAAQLAAQVLPRTPTPLSPTPIPVLDRYASVWKYEPHTPLEKEDWTPQLATQAWDLLETLHDGTRNPTPEQLAAFPSTTLHQTVMERLSQQPPYSPNSLRARQALTRVSRTISEEWERLKRANSSRLVFAHGDPHAGNILLPKNGDNNGSLYYCDWESAGYALREWDLAGLSYNIRRLAGNQTAWRALEKKARNIDWHVFRYCELVKATSNASYLATHPHLESIFVKRVEILEHSIDAGEPLPETLPSIPAGQG